MLPVPENFVEEKNRMIISKKEIFDNHKLLGINEAFGLACKFVQEKKERIVWFEYNNVVYHIYVWHKIIPRLSNVRVSKFKEIETWFENTYSAYHS